MGLASWKSGKLTRKCSPADTSLYLNADLGITSGRLYAKNDTQVEFIAFTGKTAISASEWQYTGLTRQLSTTAVPATSLGGWYTWLANQDFIHDLMHDQINDQQNPSAQYNVALTYATTAARDIALGGDGVATKPYTNIYVTATQLFYEYNLGLAIWQALGTSVAPSATITWEIRLWPLLSPPAWWFVCDWSNVSRATYASLFAVLGTTYGVGDGSTTFGIPNFSNRTAIGNDITSKVVIDDCESAWTAWSNVTATNDLVDFKTGTASVKLAVAWGAVASQILGYKTITVNLAGKTTIGMWIKSDIALASGDIRYQLDDTWALASPIESINIPALVANQWTKVYLTLATPSLDTAIITGGMFQVVDKGAFNLWIDDIATGENYEIGATGGEKTHTLSVGEIPSHTHNVWVWSSSLNGTAGAFPIQIAGWPTTTDTWTWWGLTHNNLSPYLSTNYIIKQ